MLNIQSMIRPYIFKDGDLEIKTKNPTQDMYVKYTANRKPDSISEFVKDLFGSMLYEEDLHYATELPVQVMLVIIKDYFDYHARQLNKVFPSSGNAK